MVCTLKIVYYDIKSLKINCFGQNLDFLGVLGHKIYKFNGNLINLGVLIHKGVKVGV